MDSRTSNRARHGLTGLGDVRFSGETVVVEEAMRARARELVEKAIVIWSPHNMDPGAFLDSIAKALVAAHAAGYAEGVQEERERSTILRRNYARHLAPAYLLAPVDVAKVCDEEIDQTGALLGYVREEAAAIRGQP